jgi:Trypsin-co-occurring domain 2
LNDVTDETKSTIGLSELISKVKQDLLSVTPGQTKDAPMLFVESVELELQVTVKQEGKAGIKIDVLTFGGGELGGGISRDDVHKVKVKLSPLFDKAQLLEWYKDLHPNEVLPAVKQSFDALLKGDDDANPSDAYDA